MVKLVMIDMEGKFVSPLLFKLSFHINHDQLHHYCLSFLFITIVTSFTITVYEVFEDTKGVIKIRKCKDRKYNGQ
jgi:hypothetical protein